ncbi:MAG: hypothetical protein WCR47_07620, partial [Desulfoplanes sp.]
MFVIAVGKQLAYSKPDFASTTMSGLEALLDRAFQEWRFKGDDLYVYGELPHSEEEDWYLFGKLFNIEPRYSGLKTLLREIKNYRLTLSPELPKFGGIAPTEIPDVWSWDENHI